MKLRRKYRLLTALIALCGVLFMQIAVAAYVCPGFQRGGGPQAMAGQPGPMASMPDCDQADTARPALCQAHCQDAKSSLDKPGAAVVHPTAVIVLAVLSPHTPLLPAPLPSTEPDSLLLRSTSPPLSIRHCCFRI